MKILIIFTQLGQFESLYFLLRQIVSFLNHKGFIAFLFTQG